MRWVTRAVLAAFVGVFLFAALFASPRAVVAALDLTQRASVASDGTQGNGDSLNASISGDGRFVAFFSAASTLVLQLRWRAEHRVDQS